MISFFNQKIDNIKIKKIYNHFINDNWVNGNIVKKFEKKLKRFILLIPLTIGSVITGTFFCRVTNLKNNSFSFPKPLSKDKSVIFFFQNSQNIAIPCSFRI